MSPPTSSNSSNSNTCGSSGNGSTSTNSNNSSGRSDWHPTNIHDIDEDALAQIWDDVFSSQRIIGIHNYHRTIPMGGVVGNYMAISITKAWTPAFPPGAIASCRGRRYHLGVQEWPAPGIGWVPHRGELSFGVQVGIATIATVVQRKVWVKWERDCIYFSGFASESGLFDVGSSLANGTHIPPTSLTKLRSLAIDYCSISSSQLVTIIHRYPLITTIFLILRIGPMPAGVKGELRFEETNFVVSLASTVAANGGLSYEGEVIRECLNPSAATRAACRALSDAEALGMDGLRGWTAPEVKTVRMTRGGAYI